MSESAGRHEIATKKVVYTLPGADAVSIRRDLPYRTDGAETLTMDLYYPPQAAGRLPAVVTVCGFPGRGFVKHVGCEFKQMEAYISWAHLVAASGMIAVIYTNREPIDDFEALLAHVGANAAALGIDARRIGLWAASGNVPLALWALMQPRREPLTCAALLYGYMLDLDGLTGVAEAAQLFRFTNAAGGRSADDLPPDLPLFVARAGRDAMPRLNEGIDRFIAHALARNLPISLVNHHTGPHAFDLHDASDASRDVIRQILAFLVARFTRSVSSTAEPPASA